MKNIFKDKVQLFALLAIIVLFSIVVTMAQLQLSPTYDEQNHVTRGIAILKTGDYRLSVHHPPLANILQGAFALQSTGEVSFNTNAEWWRPDGKSFMNIWAAARDTIWGIETNNGIQLVTLARIGTLLFSVILLIIIYLWAAELFGAWGGVVAAGLYALDPTNLAHSGLATTDAPAACVIVASLYFTRKYLINCDKRWLIIAGIVSGLALATKYSALIIVPIIGLLFIFDCIQKKIDFKKVVKVFGNMLVLAVIAGVTLWGVYGFKTEALGAKPGEKLSETASFKQKFPVPAKQYFRGIAVVKKEAKEHLSYIFGNTDTTGKGCWYYFPVAILTKTPVPELIVFFVMLSFIAIPSLRAKICLPLFESTVILIPIVIYTLSALGVLGISLNLGIRHVLPIFPFMCIAGAGLLKILSANKKYIAVLPVLFILQILALIPAFPDYISYFNAVSGGSKNGYRILIDSNYDWGQDLKTLAKVQKEKNIYPLAFSYFGTTPPGEYGIECTDVSGYGVMDDAPVLPDNEYSGYLAISATQLAGGPDFNHTDSDYRKYLQQKPYLRVGRTIFIFKLER
jgi:4-amino-4-deoxy-L-arabinose transferase-like glycosyltransferase